MLASVIVGGKSFLEKRGGKKRMKVCEAKECGVAGGLEGGFHEMVEVGIGATEANKVNMEAGEGLPQLRFPKPNLRVLAKSLFLEELVPEFHFVGVFFHEIAHLGDVVSARMKFDLGEKELGFSIDEENVGSIRIKGVGGVIGGGG